MARARWWSSRQVRCNGVPHWTFARCLEAMGAETRFDACKRVWGTARGFRNRVVRAGMRTRELGEMGSAELVASLRELVRRGNALTAEVLAHLAEVEARELHLSAGCSSMFVYCTSVLGLAEGSAYRRITAARVARRFPMILEC